MASKKKRPQWWSGRGWAAAVADAWLEDGRTQALSRVLGRRELILAFTGRGTLQAMHEQALAEAIYGG